MFSYLREVVAQHLAAAGAALRHERLRFAAQPLRCGQEYSPL